MYEHSYIRYANQKQRGIKLARWAQTKEEEKKINMNYVLLVDLFPLLSGSLVRKIIPDLNNCGWIRIMVLSANFIRKFFML
jgi:hypothetical protein